MTELLNALMRYGPAALCGAGGAIIAALLSRRPHQTAAIEKGANDAPPLLSAMGLLAFRCALAAAMLVASRSILGAVPALRPRVEAEWAVWAGALGVALGFIPGVLERAVRRGEGPDERRRILPAMAALVALAVLIGVLEVTLGLRTAIGHFTPSRAWLVRLLAVLGVALPWVLWHIAASRAAYGPVASLIRERLLTLVLLLAVALTIPTAIFAFFAKTAELSIAIGAVLVWVLLVNLVMPRRGFTHAIVALTLPTLACAWLALWAYASLPPAALVLAIAGLGAAPVSTLLRGRASPWWGAVAAGAILGATFAGAAVLTHRANPPSPYGLAPPNSAILQPAA